MAPIGAIAVYQTSRLSDALAERATEGLLSATIDAVTDEIAAAEGVIGSASAVSLYAQYRWNEGTACQDMIQSVIARHTGYSFVGLLTEEGLTCTGAENLSALEALDWPPSAFAVPDTFLVSESAGGPSGRQTIIAQPVFSDSGFNHYVLLRATSSRLSLEGLATSRRPEGIVTFTADGVVLSSSMADDMIASELPAALSLSELASAAGTVFADANGAGEPRHFSIVPIHDDRIFALASWTAAEAKMPAAGSRLAPWIFPIAMWLATLAITYVALSRLVVRHVRRLGLRMRRFAQNRNISEIGETSPLEPSEFRDINESFLAMAEVIIQDEAELENAVHEKTLLVREVHHRVKNNLQLIASIMNMQIRKSRNSETGEVLGRLQERVLGLAAIHRQMYSAKTLERVPADSLVEAILAQTLRVGSEEGVDVTRNIQPLSLVTDQAVPLALLTAEATTNAVQYLGEDREGRAFIDISLSERDDGNIRLRVRNSVSAETDVSSEGLVAFRKQGLGAQLIDAFTRQLGGTLNVESEEGTYSLSVTFPRASFDNEEEEAQNNDPVTPIRATSAGRS
ncbi:GHKL domain-containing protein [Alphaproteobacteria bacterium GH1-50]|uniref:histidine kinase n=1 Tax=Kangsaoukella pontilimi TaxID=2691042 RepID=A0A7C9IEP1_9RHOB|nr:sensor histidine kinase [Kangsaoukella pontilimi]MXQ06729.1 GHKL domain-containing protein [Kangsaoukella pontilimi]